MPKSTAAAIGKQPMAVVMLASQLRSPDTVGDWDFEWFITPEGVEEFWEAVTKWATDDIQDVGDLIHVIVEVTDTGKGDPSKMTLGRIAVFAPEKDADDNAVVTDTWKAEREQYVRDNPAVLIAPSPKRAAKATTKKVTPPKQPAKARVKNEAAKDIKVEPKVKGKAARKAVAKVRARKGAVSPSQVPDVLKGVTTEDVEVSNGDVPTTDQRAADLKARLEAKGTKPEVDDDIEVEQQAAADEAAVEAEHDKALAPAMGFRINILR